MHRGALRQNCGAFNSKMLLKGIRETMRVSRLARNDEILFPQSPLKEVQFLKEQASIEICPENYERGKPPKTSPEAIYERPSLPPKRLKKFRKQEFPSGTGLEFHVCRVTFPIHETQPPYYPWLFLLVDEEDRQVIDHSLFGPNFNAELVLDLFLRTLERKGFIPYQVTVKDQLCFAILESLSCELEIPLKLARSLPALDDALRAIIQHHREGNSSDSF